MTAPLPDAPPVASAVAEATPPDASAEARRLVKLHRSSCAQLCEASSSVTKADAAERDLLAYVAGLEAARLRGAPSGRFSVGDRVRKTKGSSWHGRVVGFYSTALTPIGYAVESEREPGNVQIYPEAALEAWDGQ